MGALDRDYWKEPQNKPNKIKSIKIDEKTKTNKKQKFDIIISEYNKNVPFFQRYIKISYLIFWVTIIIIEIIVLGIYAIT